MAKRIGFAGSDQNPGSTEAAQPAQAAQTNFSMGFSLEIWTSSQRTLSVAFRTSSRRFRASTDDQGRTPGGKEQRRQGGSNMQVVVRTHWSAFLATLAVLGWM